MWRFVHFHMLKTRQNLQILFHIFNPNFCFFFIMICYYIDAKMLRLPKHIPHNPVRMVSRMTQPIFPCRVNPNIEKLNIRTNVVWPDMITNWVATCENRISMPVTPDTRHLSNMPSFRSINIAPDVNATDKKKMMVKITPGAAKSVKFGVWSP